MQTIVFIASCGVSISPEKKWRQRLTNLPRPHNQEKAGLGSKPLLFSPWTASLDGGSFSVALAIYETIYQTGCVGNTRDSGADAGVRVPTPQESCLQDDE